MCLNEGMFKGAKVVACREDSPTRNDRGRRLTLKLQEKDGKRNEKCTENELCIWARGGGDPTLRFGGSTASIRYVILIVLCSTGDMLIFFSLEWFVWSWMAIVVVVIEENGLSVQY